jgi:putative GTP pyrophosphokinase
LGNVTQGELNLADKSKVDEAVEWYQQKHSLYKSLAGRVESLVRDILEQEGITYHDITSRTKSIDKYREKASKEKYTDPQLEIMDMAGIRIITYINPDAEKVEEIIRKNFEVDDKHSSDKSAKLGINEFGYKSIHCICKLGKHRSHLLEYQKYSDLLFEIQIRTILQHAWAEFEHDKNYKFKGILPDNMQRRLARTAGTLELLDWEFESLAKDIDDYSDNVKLKYESGDLNTSLTSASLKVYLKKRFSKMGEALKPNRDKEDDIKMVEELENVGIHNLDALDKSIPNDFDKKVLELSATYLGLLRYIIIIRDSDTYFDKAWNYSWWYLDDKKALRLLEHYGIPEKKLRNYLKKRKALIPT